MATIFHCSFFLWLLFEGGIYFFGKLTDIKGGWIRYIRVIQWWLLGTVSSLHSLSVLLSALETSRTTPIALVLAWWPSSEIIHTRLHVLAMVTFGGRRLLHSHCKNHLVKMTTSEGYCSFRVHWTESKTQLSSINPLTIHQSSNS